LKKFLILTVPLASYGNACYNEDREVYARQSARAYSSLPTDGRRIHRKMEVLQE
jgi:hypothetical protein